MGLVEVSPQGSILLTPEYFTFVEAAAGTIGDQQVAMGLYQAPRCPARLRKSTRCPFCDAEGYTVRVVWKDGSATATGTCAACGVRSESRWIRPEEELEPAPPRRVVRRVSES